MKFYQRSWFIWLMLLMFAPGGIALLWSNKKYMKPTRTALSLLFAALCLLGITYNRSSGTDFMPAAGSSVSIFEETGMEGDFIKPGNGTLVVRYLYVGQGDAILVQQGSHAMIIDAGPPDSADALSAYLTSQNITELELFVGTHVHDDHIGGSAKLISSLKVDKILYPKQIGWTDSYEAFIDAAADKDLKLTVPKAGKRYTLGSAEITVLAPNGSDYSNENDYSIILRVVFGKTSFLFTGDAGTHLEYEMLDNDLDLSADVLKVGHHGSVYSSGGDFLDAVHPKYAIISCGIDNRYNFPSSITLAKLKQRNIAVYETDKGGTITAVSNGKTVTMYQSGTAPTQKATPKPTATPTPRPTATPAAVFTTSVDNASPPQNTNVVLTVSGPGGTFTAICRYKSKKTTYTGTVGEPLSIDTGTAAPGYKVLIDVTVSYNGNTYTAQTSFTPTGEA